ncbi:hypothetical protein PWT90_05030 [Aphanocladium album]|nr:hypothetical protein PWT90_05030 [Aphanocladium album]
MSLSKRAIAQSTPNPVLEVLCNLWHPASNPAGFLSLGVAENTLMHSTLNAHVRASIQSSLPNEAFTYCDGYQRLGRAVARFLTRHLRPVVEVKPAHMTIVNGCTSGIENMALCFTDPGDYILLGRPYYTAFLDDATLRTGARMAEISYPPGEDPLGPDCVQRYEERILKIQAEGGRVGALILCNPHNPLGRCYPHDVLVEFMKLCEKYQIHLISDEIYALSTFANTLDTHPPPTPFESILSVDPAGLVDPARIHVLWGLSKDFGANGIRLGVVLSQHNPGVRATLQPAGLFSSISSLTEHAASCILEDDAWVEAYVKENQSLLGLHHAHIATWARRNGIEYAAGANAGFFIWMNLGKKYLEHHPEAKGQDLDHITMDALLANKVFLAAGFRFGADEPGWFRIVYTQEMDYLNLGLARVLAALTGDPIPELSQTLKIDD